MFAAKNELFTTPSGYQIQRSLRFRFSASAYLNRTPSTTTNRKTYTWSAWVKRGQLGVFRPLFFSEPASNQGSGLNFNSDDTLQWYTFNNTVPEDYGNITTAVYRDPAAWYHVVLAIDTTQATASNRARIWINGVQQIFNQNYGDMPQNSDTFINVAGAPYYIGRETTLVGTTFDGYMTEINFIDGQALTPSSFGAINATTGVWSATKYAGTYGTNGFYLNFTDNSAATATTIGKDFSGNGNNWTPNNISVTAGATYDSMLDAPLGAGGGERGNYAVMNPVATNTVGVATLTNGNLTFSVPNTFTAIGSMSATSGKYYWEAIATSNPVGVGLKQVNVLDRYSNTIYYMGSSLSPSGEKYVNGTASAYGASWTTGDVIGVAVDMDGGTVTFYKNNASQGSIALSTASITAFVPSFVAGAGVTFAGSVNFGQRPFSYTPPTGFKALHTGNLGAPVIALPAQNMAATLYTGNGSTRTITGVGFQPDLVWIKDRTGTAGHALHDAVRTSPFRLASSSTNAESDESASFTGFASDGFSLAGNDTTYNNNTPRNYVSWNWKANGAGVSNTAGSITSTVSANTTAGFSVATWTGNATGGATIGHGLGVAPSFVISKRRDSADDWSCYHISLGGTKYIDLNSTAAAGTSIVVWNNTNPSSTVVTLGTSNRVNASGGTYVAYCFTPVAGYSAFGSYTGNGSTDGPFVYLGFRPRFVMVKSSSNAFEWVVRDSTRSTYNLVDSVLNPNSSAAEVNGGGYGIDFLSNGFKVRAAGSATNGNTFTYIYMAFAEDPFKNSLAR